MKKRYSLRERALGRGRTSVPQPAGLRNTPRSEESSQGFSTPYHCPFIKCLQLQVPFVSKNNILALFNGLYSQFGGRVFVEVNLDVCPDIRASSVFFTDLFSHTPSFLPYYISSNIILVDSFIQPVLLRLATDRIPMTISWVNA
jgi:hypothetical protein